MDNMKYALTALTVFAILYCSCRTGTNHVNPVIAESERLDKLWLSFTEICFKECMQKNKSGKYYMHGRLYTCDRDTIYEYGWGVMKPRIVPDDACPDANRIWNSDADYFLK